MSNKHFKTFIVFIAAVLMLTCLPAFAFASTDSQPKNVRVGWFGMDNFMEGGNEGAARSGFTFELLCEIATYSNWDIEYVSGEFSDLYKLLEKGEIDVLPNVIATEERRENILFHDFSINEEHYYICTLRDNDLDVETDPAAISGKKLVVIKDAYEEKYFDAWAQENNVSMEKVYCEGYDAAWELVRQKKADYVLNINNTAPDSSFRTLYEVGIDNVYFAVAQGREDVLKDIDSALLMIDEISPFLISNLRQKYLNKALSSYQLTADEKNWIETHDTLRIGGLQNDVPYAYKDENGAVTGAYVELTRLILKKLNIDSIQVEWFLYGSMDELRSALKNNDLDLICPEYHSYSEAERNGFAISETIMNIPMGMLTLDSGGKGAVSTIATGGTRPGLIFVEENYPGVEIKALNSVDSLVKAVEDHEADAAVAHIFALQESIENKKTGFILTPLSEPCIICYASLEENHELVMLMNRGFHLIEQSEKATMELQVASAEVSKTTLINVIKDNLLVVVLIMLFIIAIIAYALSRAVASQKLKEAADQLSSYKRAVLSDALISLEANLTKNQLYYGVWKDDNGKEIPLKDILGLELPASYDEYIKQWNLKFVKKGYGTDFSGKTDREYLLSTFENGTSDVSFDYEARTTSGKEVWLRRTINMTRNLDGDVVAYTNVKDISRLVEQEKRENAYIRAIATEYDSIVVVGIEDGEYMDNMYLQRQLNNELTESVDAEAGRESGFQEKLEILYGFVYPEDRDQFIEDTKKETIFRSFANNMTHVVRFRMSDVDGGYVYYQSRFIPLRDDSGKLIGMLVCERNVDKEMRKELSDREDLKKSKIAAESANRAKTTFLFNMSHDIRTPMNAIIGFTKVARKKTNEPETKDYLEKIDVAGNQLLSLVNQVLEMARIESGKIVLQEQKIDVNNFVNVINTVYGDTAKAMGLSLTAEVRNVEHGHVIGDNERLSQIANNLIGNALKYTPEGGSVTTLVEEEACDKPGYAVYRLTVEDTGIGMREDYLPHIFEEFTREETSTVSRIQGTGLGMPIVKKLADLMGGTIEVSSMLGAGSKFVVRIPLRIDASFTETENSASEEQHISLEGMKILLVEDNEMNREIATEILTEVGLVVETAEDGLFALQAVTAKGVDYYDFVLMDIQMPVMDGFEATKAIRALPGGDRVKIIALSANAFEEDIQKSLTAGMNAHVAKPIDVAKLFDTMQSLV